MGADDEALDALLSFFHHKISKAAATLLLKEGMDIEFFEGDDVRTKGDINDICAFDAIWPTFRNTTI